MKPMVFFNGLLQPSKLFLNDDFKLIEDWPSNKLRVYLNFDCLSLPQGILEVKQIEALTVVDPGPMFKRFAAQFPTLQVREGVVGDARVGDLYFLLVEDDR